MHWPYRPDNWRSNAVPAQIAFTNVITAIAQFEPVSVACSKSCMDVATSYLGSIPNVTIVHVESDDSWMRDTGPTFVVSPEGGRRGVDWKFNFWGNMGMIDGVNYINYDNDILVASKVLESASVERYEADFVLEGGSIHVDGEGTCITTEECLLNENRNPHLTKSEIESRLKAFLGVQCVVWLPKGLVADEDTNGHVDNFCAYFAPSKVLLSWCDDDSDPLYEICRTALEILSNTKDAKGRSFTVVKLPVPPPMHYTAEEVAGLATWGPDSAPIAPRGVGERLAASYANFYITNGEKSCFLTGHYLYV